ncbi:hypothetical protein AQZ52_12955 [Novosphingobium fuchskuhlense]|uniref:Porin domain-containing protein n=2 Tax=Novosphingobium fuchskuhlense TaxID=1117702 RepID=A0A117UTV6_9SPHN|nr:hypothetical protein AQZ52_12955 [Novosphingobium fuchskuhlense]
MLMLLAAAVLGPVASGAARGQALDAGAEAASDEVRAGLSWSGGAASASVDARLDVSGIDTTARAVLLRGARRHGRADILVDLAVGRDWSMGAITLRTELAGHIFSGAAQRMDFAELVLGARYGIGPLRLVATAWYAPRQSTIGGDNLHLRGSVDGGLPGLPITLAASLGYTTGRGDGPRAIRLRPGGDYADWKLTAEYARYPLMFGLDYVGTDIGDRAARRALPFADPAGAGDRIVARMRFSF